MHHCQNIMAAEGILLCAIGAAFLVAPALGHQQYVLTFAPPVLIMCICHWVALRIYLRR